MCIVYALQIFVFDLPHANAADTRIFITSGTTWTVPSDWNNASNTVEVIGAGGNSNNSSTAGAGGGAYSKKTNLSLTPGSSVSVQVGANRDTWFSSSATVLAKKGVTSTSVAGAAGGAAASGVGDLKYSGGNGANGTNGASGGGGGGAAGPNGDGNNGAAPNNPLGGAGGSGDAGFGGAGGGGGEGTGNDGHPGSAGTEYDASHGAGGGGGGSGAAGDFNPVGGAGGSYGGGAGGNSNSGANGAPGLIAITYTPAVSGGGQKFLMGFEVWMRSIPDVDHPLPGRIALLSLLLLLFAHFSLKASLMPESRSILSEPKISV